MGQSIAEQIAALPENERKEALADLSEAELADLAHNWRFWGRPEQFAPEGDWSGWLLMAGRGFGKSRSGAEWIRERVYAGATRISLIAATSADARDVMIEGESGLLNIFPAPQRPEYEPSKRKLTFHTGASALLFSAEEPERLRGPQCDTLWADEVGAWRYEETWHLAMMTLRLGNNPRWCATTTPRPTALVKSLVADPSVMVTRGSTYDNASNLAEQYLSNILKNYEGTRLSRQEILGELLLDTPGALWTWQMIEKAQWKDPVPELSRIVIGVDPAVSDGDKSDATGILVCGIDKAGFGYVLHDASMRGSPLEWASAVIRAFDAWEADKVIVETNQGGQMVEETLRSVRRSLPIKQVRASRGKMTRAEPIAALYEQGKIRHTNVFKDLEGELTTYVAGSNQKSPDRMDALVWAFSELFNKKEIYINIIEHEPFRGGISGERPYGYDPRNLRRRWQ